jgi:hypothetical protein
LSAEEEEDDEAANGLLVMLKAPKSAAPKSRKSGRSVNGLLSHTVSSQDAYVPTGMASMSKKGIAATQDGGFTLIYDNAKTLS